MKITFVSERLIAETKKEEKFVSTPYLCPAGKWTIGYGTTWYFDTKKRVSKNDTAIDEKEADRLLRGHFATAVCPLVDRLCRDDLNQNQFDAVADFIYNAGATYADKKRKIHYYRLFEHINNYLKGADLIEYWHKLAITANGKRLSGLIKRRKKEVALFLSN